MPKEKLDNSLKQLTLRLPTDIHKGLKLLAVNQGKSMTDLVVAWISEKIKATEKGKR